VKVSFGVDLTAIVAQLRNYGKVQTGDHVGGHHTPRSAPAIGSFTGREKKSAAEARGVNHEFSGNIRPKSGRRRPAKAV